MQINKFLARLLAAVFTVAAFATSAQAALVGRDINGNAVASNAASSVFLYDTDLNITWLRDANVNGPMTWAQANTWATGYSIGIYDDWRLPTVVQPDLACALQLTPAGFGVQAAGFNCTGSEMGHLWYTELGNTAASFTNDGEFLNMQSTVYWSGTEYAPFTGWAWYLNFADGEQFYTSKERQFYAMAVRSNDVLVDPTSPGNTVPEPESMLLALTALSAVALVRRRRSVGSSAL